MTIRPVYQRVVWLNPTSTPDWKTKALSELIFALRDLRLRGVESIPVDVTPEGLEALKSQFDSMTAENVGEPFRLEFSVNGAELAIEARMRVVDWREDLMFGLGKADDFERLT